MRRHTPPQALLLRPFRVGEGLDHATVGALRGPAYRTLMHGVRIAADEDDAHGWLVRAMRKRLGDEPVLVGTSAAHVHGVRLEGDGRVHTSVPADRVLRPRPGVTPHRHHLEDGEIVTTALGPATSRARTAVDLARGIGTAHVDADTRLAMVEAYLRGARLPAEQARAHAAGLERLRGLPAARALLAMARDGVDSPQETALRLLIVRHGLPEPVTQCPVYLDGRVVANLDMGWEEYRVGAEYDGEVHRERRRHSLDIARHNRIRQADWVALRADSRTMRHPREFLSQLDRLVPRCS